jgi:hypothetical protein
METLKLEFVVKDSKGNVLSTLEIDYVDELNLDKPHTKQLFMRFASIAVEEAKNKVEGSNLRCPKCDSVAIRVLPFNFPRGFCRACKHKATLRDFKVDSNEGRAAA